MQGPVNPRTPYFAVVGVFAVVGGDGDGDGDGSDAADSPKEFVPRMLLQRRYGRRSRTWPTSFHVEGHLFEVGQWGSAVQ